MITRKLTALIMIFLSFVNSHLFAASSSSQAGSSESPPNPFHGNAPTQPELQNQSSSPSNSVTTPSASDQSTSTNPTQTFTPTDTTPKTSIPPPGQRTSNFHGGATYQGRPHEEWNTPMHDAP